MSKKKENLVFEAGTEYKVNYGGGTFKVTIIHESKACPCAKCKKLKTPKNLRIFATDTEHDLHIFLPDGRQIDCVDCAPDCECNSGIIGYWGKKRPAIKILETFLLNNNINSAKIIK